MTAQAYVLTQFNGPDGLRRRDIAAPAPGPGEVRVRVRAVSLNHRDLMVTQGDFAAVTRQDLIIGSDAAGEVAEIGPGVSRFQPGARVIATFVPDWIGGAWVPSPGSYGRGMAVQGVMATEIVLREEELVPIPAHLNFEEAATLPCAAVTAWSALCAGQPPLPGESVLVQGSGGVSIFALQLAQIFGQHIVATSSSPEKIHIMNKLGAHDLVNYRTAPDWQHSVLAATNGLGVDRTVEIGGAATFAKSIAATRMGGRIAVVGLLTGAPAPGAALFMRGLTLYPVRVGSRQDFEAMNRAISFHRLRPIIDQIFAFDEVIKAMKYLEQGQHVGKIVIRVQ